MATFCVKTSGRCNTPLAKDEYRRNGSLKNLIIIKSNFLVQTRLDRWVNNEMFFAKRKDIYLRHTFVPNFFLWVKVPPSSRNRSSRKLLQVCLCRSTRQFLAFDGTSQVREKLSRRMLATIDALRYTFFWRKLFLNDGAP